MIRFECSTYGPGDGEGFSVVLEFDQPDLPIMEGRLDLLLAEWQRAAHSLIAHTAPHEHDGEGHGKVTFDTWSVARGGPVKFGEDEAEEGTGRG